MPHDRRNQPRVTLYRAEIPETGETREVEYESIDDAVHFACRDLREGRRRPLGILEDGVVIYDPEALARLCAERQREREEG